MIIKKLVLLIGVLAVISLAAFNLNLTLNKGLKASVEFSTALSFAQDENTYNGKCATKYEEYISDGGYYADFFYTCISGDNSVCTEGVSVWYYGQNVYNTVSIQYCR